MVACMTITQAHRRRHSGLEGKASSAGLSSAQNMCVLLCLQWPDSASGIWAPLSSCA